jgi:hypothetical protein
MTACRSRHAEDGKHVGANPSLNEGGYSPMTGPEVGPGRLCFKTRAARRRTRIKACLRSADDTSRNRQLEELAGLLFDAPIGAIGAASSTITALSTAVRVR